MGSMGNFSNGPRPVEYTSLMKSLCSVEQMYERVVYEILVEPKLPHHGTTFRYILEELPTCPCSAPRKDTFHVNGSLKSRASRARKMQRRFQRYSEKAYQAAKIVQKKFARLNYQLCLVKKQKSLEDAKKRLLSSNKRNIHEIRLQLGIDKDVEAAKSFCRKGPNGEDIHCNAGNNQESCSTSSDSDSCSELETGLLHGLGDEPNPSSRMPLTVDYMLNIAYRNRRPMQLTNPNISQNRNQGFYDSEFRRNNNARGAQQMLMEQSLRGHQQNRTEGQQNTGVGSVGAVTRYTEVFIVCI